MYPNHFTLGWAGVLTVHVRQLTAEQTSHAGSEFTEVVRAGNAQSLLGQIKKRAFQQVAGSAVHTHGGW